MRRSLVVAAAALAIGAADAAAQPFPTTAPVPGPAPTLNPPAATTRTLANGMKVMYVRLAELPTVHATLLTRGGTADEPAASPGLASFAASLLDEGAAGKSSLEISDALDALGASLGVGAGWDGAQADLYVLRKNFPAALALMADVVTKPDFPEAEVARVREERLVALQRGKDEPGVIAGNAFQSLVYGAGSPYGRFATTDATRAMDRAAVAAFHAAFYRPAETTLILAGDVSPEALHAEVERAFGGWRAAGAVPAPVAPAARELGRTVVYLVDKPGAAQSEIRIGHPGVARSHPDYYPLTVLNTVLGGSFTSRLNQNLRETHGYTYGAGSSYAMRRGAGPFSARAAVVTAKTDSALVEFFKELNRIRDEPVSQAELDRAKRYVALGYPADFETPTQVAGQFGQLVTYGIAPSFFREFVPRVMAVTAADVQRVAREHVRPGNAVVVVVGDRATIEAGIRALNLGNVEIRPVEEFVK
jgi:predicted Zn-dependent peptidase